MRIHRPTLLTAIEIALISLCIGAVLFWVGWRHTNDRITSNQHKVDQSWCRFLEKLDYPRTTAAGKRFTDALDELERERGCIK